MKYILILMLLRIVSSFRLSLIRHANTFNNNNNIYTGHTDIPILDINQKVNFNNKYDLILSSPMLRCKQTLDILNLKNSNIIYDNRFIECGYGDLTNKNKNQYIFKREFYNKPNDSELFIGESRMDGGLRAFNALNYHLKHSAQYNDNILIMSHKNTLKGLWVFLKLQEEFKEKNVEELYNYANLKTNLDFIINNHYIPNFNNLEIYNF